MNGLNSRLKTVDRIYWLGVRAEEIKPEEPKINKEKL